MGLFLLSDTPGTADGRWERIVTVTRNGRLTTKILEAGAMSTKGRLGRTETKSATWCQYQTNQRIKSTARGRHQKGRTKDNHHQTASEEVLELVWPIPLRMNYDWTNLNHFTQASFEPALVKIGQVVSGGKGFQQSSMYFYFFAIISPWKITSVHILKYPSWQRTNEKNGILAKHHLLRLNDKL